jgi:hypothetical protein
MRMKKLLYLAQQIGVRLRLHAVFGLGFRIETNEHLLFQLVGLLAYVMDISDADSHVPTARDAAISMPRIQELAFGEEVMLRKCFTVRREFVNRQSPASLAVKAAPRTNKWVLVVRCNRPQSP